MVPPGCGMRRIVFCMSAGFAEDSVLFVVRVGSDIDVFALNEALTAVQLARGLSPSAQLDVVFQP